MKFIKAENAQPLEGLELGKVRLTCNGETETIWVKKDGDVCYLQNHAICFYPFPSWGTQLPNKSEFDATALRGATPNDTVLTVHPESYDWMATEGWIDSEGLLTPKYFEDQNMTVEEVEIDDKSNNRTEGSSQDVQ